jgi:preprotein translocase subunit SecE
MENLNIGTILTIVFAALFSFVVITNFAKIKKFILEVYTELKKVAWSTRKDVVDATWIVIMSSAFLGLFIGVTDFALSNLLKIILR